MSRTRLFLAVSTLLWLPYGLYCLASPGFLRDAAGVASLTPTGTTELRAMYGGLQAAIGALSLAGFLRAELERPALIALAALAAGLFLGRVAGALADGGLSAYTIGALVLEASLATFATRLLR
jgi:uncharacterized YccA/Bax inhibitor family protein